MNMYFVVLCYYLIYNVFKRIKWVRMLIVGFIALLGLVFTFVLIDSIVMKLQSCKQLSYLITYSLGLFICIVMFIAYRFNQIKQKQRIQKFNKILQSDQIFTREKQLSSQKFIKIKTPSRVNFKTPFKNIWLLINCNILCRIIGLVESLVFQFDWDQNDNNNCNISENDTVNNCVNLIFSIFTVYLGFIATIWVFRQKRKAKNQFYNRNKSPSDFTSVVSGRNVLQMIPKDLFGQNYSDQPSNLSGLYEKRESYKNYQKQSNQQQSYQNQIQLRYQNQ